MQNIKKILIFSMFMLSSSKSFCFLDGISEKAAKIIAPAAVDVAEILAPAAVDASKALGADAAKALGADAAKIVVDGNLAVVKEIMPVVGVVAAVGVTIYGITQLQPIIKDTCEIFYPTEEQQEKSAVAGRMVKYYKAEEKFIDCMIKNKPGVEINQYGRPTDCEEAARAFALCGGNKMVAEITKIFNEYK